MSDGAVRRLATIGVYGWTLDAFLHALAAADVAVLLDIRQRRGVRGSEYAWANSRRLQAELAQAGLGYRHHPELAPTTELRRLQYREDAKEGVGKRSRSVLAPEYARRYTSEIVDLVDLAPLVEALPRDAASALFCVELDPEACHRSLVAERIGGQFGLSLSDLRP